MQTNYLDTLIVNRTLTFIADFWFVVFNHYNRAEGTDDVMLSSSEIKNIALSIEEELFKYFKDTDAKYKAKYRSLIFNIKDQKNKVSLSLCFQT